MTDLPYRRRTARPSWMEPIMARLTPAIKALVITISFLYLFYVFVPAAEPLMAAHLALGPLFFRGELWQPLTALVMQNQFLQFIFDLVGLWFVGAYTERLWGTRRFLLTFLGAGVVANLVTAGVMFAAGGAHPVYLGCGQAVLALFIAHGRLFGRQPLQVFGGLVMQARSLAAVMLVWFVLTQVFQRDWPGVAGTLAAAGVGFFSARRGGWRELTAGFRGLSSALRTWRARRRYRVLDGGAPRRGRSRKDWN
jgi:membrane associated rhomboid family serine protease